MPSHLPGTRLQRLSLLLIIALGFGLRFGGLNHDLHEEVQYHPDTSKQIRAVQRFLDGRYYYHTGILDYDIYPYLHAHLLEYICRAGDALHGGLQALTGVPVTSWRPEYYQLFWIALAWNALLATLLILIVFQLVRENWDMRAALVAALLLAVSPMDVVACHFAGADTTAGFFATLTVFFALRIYRLGRARDYVLAALFGACGFSAKYHAGLAVLPVLLAHGLRVGSWRGLVGRAALGRLGLLALVGLVAVALTTPIFLTHFTETIQNIIGFFNQVTSFRGADESIRSGGWGTKLAFGLQHALPMFVRILGPLVCLGVLLGLKNVFRRQPDPRAMILYALPLCYFFAGGGLRPTAHPIVQTLMTPLLFIAAAVLFTRPFRRSDNEPPALAGLRWLVIAVAAAWLFSTAARESLLFWHQDTRRLALAWTEENVPAQFSMATDNYSFTSGKFSASSNAVGHAQAIAFSRPPAPPYRHLKTFAVETDGLPVFRNIPVRCYISPSDWLRPDFQMPISQRAASGNGNRIICDNGPEFLRSEKLLVLEADDGPAVRHLVRTAALSEAWVGIQNGNSANLVDIQFGGASQRASLNAGEVVWWRIAVPQHNWPNDPGYIWYRWTAQAYYGRVRVLLATRPDEIGQFLFNAGNYRDALPLLQTSAASSHSPLLATLALICAQQAPTALAPATRAGLQRLAQPLQKVGDAASCRQLCGIAPAYLEALDFIKLEAGALRFAGCRFIEDLEAPHRRALEKVAVPVAAAATNPPPSIVTPMVQLDPGAYTVNLLVRGTDKTSAPIRWRMTAQDLFGTTHATAELELPPLDHRRYTRVAATFQIPFAAPELRLVLQPHDPAGVVLGQLEIKPDVLGTIRWLKQSLPQPTSVANTAPPASPEVQQIVDTVFQGGVRLERIQYERATLRRGQPFKVRFALRLELPGLDTADHAVFIHLVDAAGHTAFQGDYSVADLLNTYAPRLVAPTQMYKTIEVPATIKPGAYTIRIGAYDLDTTKRLRIVSSPLPQKTKAVALREPLHITE
jgi:hypothetical protein